MKHHNHGMRYNLRHLPTNRETGEKQWDGGSHWFLHKTGGKRELVGRKATFKLETAQKASGEWKEL